MPHGLHDLPSHSPDKLLHVIVESPRSARVKYEYSAEDGVFRIKRPLPAGLAYPFDWGFIPGTRAADGDPVDAMLLGDHVAYPGTLVECRAIAILNVTERPSGESETQENPRIIAAPEWLETSVAVHMLKPLQDDIAEFLERVGEDTGKQILDTSWGDAEDAEAFISAHGKRARK